MVTVRWLVATHYREAFPWGVDCSFSFCSASGMESKNGCQEKRRINDAAFFFKALGIFRRHRGCGLVSLQPEQVFSADGRHLPFLVDLGKTPAFFSCHPSDERLVGMDGSGIVSWQRMDPDPDLQDGGMLRWAAYLSGFAGLTEHQSSLFGDQAVYPVYPFNDILSRPLAEENLVHPPGMGGRASRQPASHRRPVAGHRLPAPTLAIFSWIPGKGYLLSGLFYSLGHLGRIHRHGKVIFPKNNPL